MARTVGYRWRLREIMATRGMFSTTDLHPHLADRGIELSAIQVYRLVAQTPERLNLQVLAALCDILDCTPNELIEPYAQAKAGRVGKTAGAPTKPGGAHGEERMRPRRARIVKDDPQ